MRDVLVRSQRRSLLCAVAALLAAGCASAPLPRYRPSLTEVDIPVDHGVAVQTLVSLVSVRPDDKAGTPAGIEVRMRLENHGNVPARIEPGSLELVGTNLESFPAPRITPPEGLSVDPGARGLLTARFPYPPDEGPDSRELGSVNLRWKVDLGEKSYVHGLTFERREPRMVTYAYPGPAYWGYWGPDWYGGGYWGGPVVVEQHHESHDRDHDR